MKLSELKKVVAEYPSLILKETDNSIIVCQKDSKNVGPWVGAISTVYNNSFQIYGWDNYDYRLFNAILLTGLTAIDER